MNDSQIAELLRSRNPWWRRAEGWEADDDYLREAAEAPFEYRPGVLEDIAPPGLYVLRGPRRIGKSVELKRSVSRLIAGQGVNPRSIVYCACNGFRAQDLRRLFAVGRNLGRGVEGPRYWLLDEITAIGNGWSAVVKDARDDTPVRNDCVVLTGSSARGLREAQKDLAGRRGGVERWQRLLLPMGFRAVGDAFGDLGDVPRPPAVRPKDFMSRRSRETIEELSYWAEDLAQAWELYLTVGGFPRALRDFHERGEARPDFIEDLWSIAAHEALGPKLTEPIVAVLLARLAENLASPLNASRVAGDVGLANYHRVNDRIDDLVESFLAWRCFRIAGGRPSPKAQRKVYFVDPLVATLAHRRGHAPQAPDPSRISEQQIGFTLARALEALDPGSFVGEAGVMYERTEAEAEIDFAGAKLGLPFESKYVDRGWKQDARTIEARHGRGVMVTRSALSLDGKVWAVPAGVAAWILSG